MLEPLAQEVQHSDRDVVASALQTRRALAARGARARHRRRQWRLLPWREIADRATQHSLLVVEEIATRVAALRAIEIRDRALRLLQATESDDADVAIAVIAHDALSPPGVVVSLPLKAAARALATLSDSYHAVRRDVLPDEWESSHPHWATLACAASRMMRDAAQRRRSLSFAFDPDDIPDWTPPRETLPQPLLRAVTTQALRIRDEDKWNLTPWLDGREAIAVLRKQGLNDATIAERMAQVGGIDPDEHGWQAFVAQPSAQRLGGLWHNQSFCEWTQCVTERDAAMAVMMTLNDDLRTNGMSACGGLALV